MQLLSALLLVALLWTAVLAAPARPQHKGRSFKIDRVRRANHVRNGAAALKKAYRKYGWTVPQTVSHASGGESGSVTATPQQGDAEFLSPVSIGGQTLMLDFDTGSSDL